MEVIDAPVKLVMPVKIVVVDKNGGSLAEEKQNAVYCGVCTSR